MTRKPGYVAAGITGLLLSAGVAIPLALLSGLGKTDRQGSLVEPYGAGATVAHVLCGEDRVTRIFPSAVQPQVDGVHIRVENRSTSPVVLDYTDAGGAYGTAPIDPGVSGMMLGVAPGTALIGCRAPGNASGETSEPSDPVPTPSVAEIVCEQDGTTRVLTPTVQPQRDGVHLRVDNRTGREMELAVHGDTQSHAASEYAPPGIVSLVSSIAPGRVGVVCVDWNDQPEPGPSADLTIVDPEGLWASPELDCGAPAGGGENEIMVVIHDHSFASPGKRGDPVELARRRFGWADSRDTVEPAGYPEADAEANGALVRIVRGGRVVATAGYHADGKGGWLLGSEWLCGGSDTAPAAWNPAGA